MSRRGPGRTNPPHARPNTPSVRAVSVTAATTAPGGTARSPLERSRAHLRPRNNSTVTRRPDAAAKGRSAGTTGPIPARTECRKRHTGYTVGWTHSSAVGYGSIAGPRPVAVKQRDRGPVVPMGMKAEATGDGRRVRTIQLRTKARRLRYGRGQRRADYDPLRRIVGCFATHALLGVVSATLVRGAPAGSTAWATGSAAAALIATRPLCAADKTAILRRDWVTLDPGR